MYRKWIKQFVKMLKTDKIHFPTKCEIELKRTAMDGI
jgi:hypothetical protein